MTIHKSDIIRVKKSDLPRPLIVEDEVGNIKYFNLNPAGEGKLGAYLSQMNTYAKETVKRLIGRR